MSSSLFLWFLARNLCNLKYFGAVLLTPLVGEDFFFKLQSLATDAFVKYSRMNYWKNKIKSEDIKKSSQLVTRLDVGTVL